MSGPLSDRLPPQNLDAERSVLGSMLRLNRVIGDMINILQKDHFYADAHQKIYQTITDHHDKGGQPVDLLILAEQLKLRGWLEDVGGPVYLAELWDAAPSAANAEHYARIVRDKALVRGLIEAGTEILAKAYNQASPAEQLIEEAAGTVFEMASKGLGGSLVTLEAAIRETYDRIDARSTQATMAHSGLNTGFTELNELTAGLQQGELIIIAARPSVGKCLAADSEIVLGDGSIATIEEVYRRQQARLLTLGDDWRLGWTEPSAFVDDGTKPVYRVTLHSGRRIETTLSHPFRTVEGWRPLAELAVGDAVAVPRVLPAEGREPMSVGQIERLAVRFGRALGRRGGGREGEAPAEPHDTRLHRFRNSHSDNSGIVGSAEATPSRVAVATRAPRVAASLPARVFRLPRQQLALFLRLLFAGRAGLKVRTRRERLARQVQHLLLRFGIPSRLRERAGKWRLAVTDRDGLARLEGGTPTPRDTRWDRIVSVEPLGEKQVYDLTIPGTHNFIANDICVHNTAFSLALTKNVLLMEKVPVFYVSLEQSRIELAERMLCSQARVDSHRLRKGTLTSDDMEKLIDAGSSLQKAHLFIDDSPQQGMLRIAANARRLKHQKDIRLIVIDYLQLIEPENRRDPRQEQVAQISRRLKFLAKELQVPVIALAQVNRAAEDRQDHRPRLSDLRESGCLAGDTLITLGSGERVPIRDLEGRAGFRVWALNERTMRLEPAAVSRAFCTGRKPVFRLTTRLGRTIRATANHPFRAFEGWRRLDDLRAGQHIALPRRIPPREGTSLSEAEAGLLGHLIGDGCTLPRHAIQYTTRELDLAEQVVSLTEAVFGEAIRPRIQRERKWFQVYLSAADQLTHGRRNPIARWLDGLGAFGLRAWEKRTPEVIFSLATPAVAAYLRGLWATDGCIRPAVRKGLAYPAVYFASSSQRLARDVQSLLLRVGINGRLRLQSQGTKGRPQHQVWVSGRTDLLAFAERIGASGAYRMASLASAVAGLAERKENTNRDVIPAEVWRKHAVPLLAARGISMRAFQSRMELSFCGSTLYKQNVSRDRLSRVSRAAGGDPTLDALAASDVYWDQVVSVTPDGDEDVFDLTVPGHHNFVADDIIAHNSIEQDADTVFMLHRPDRYEPGQHEGILEIIVAKQRNGPTGEVTLAYIKQYLAYEDFKVGTPFDH